MITIEDVGAALDGLGLPWANTKFKERVEPPFLLLVASNRDAVFADGLNWPSDTNYTLYLVSENRDYANERIVEGMFEGLGIPYRMDFDTIDDDDIVQAYFTFSVED